LSPPAGANAGAGAAAEDASSAPSIDPRCSAPAPDQPAARGARFHFAAASAFVVDRSKYFDPLTIVSKSGDELPLSVPYPCGCECSRPAGDGARPAASLAQPYTLTWDGRFESLYTCAEEDCSKLGFGAGWGKITHGSLALASPGHYRVTFRVIAPDHQRRYLAADGSLVAGNNVPGDEPTFDREVAVDFDLPEAGYVDVDVAVPAK
jgi:hypothetical protein